LQEVGAKFVDTQLAYAGNKEDFKLRIPKFEVKAGEVCAIVGRVGSGEFTVPCAVLGTCGQVLGQDHMSALI
jgi:ABC-type bacteriocin/lantibiotic exporter with double-glycine peptidase domain